MLAIDCNRKQARSHKLGALSMQVARRIVSQFRCHRTSALSSRGCDVARTKNHPRAIGDLGKTPGGVLDVNNNRVYRTDTLFIRTINTVGARERAMAAASPLIDLQQHIELQRPHLRGRRPVRADRRLHADEKHICAQSAILEKNPAVSSMLTFARKPARRKPQAIGTGRPLA